MNDNILALLESDDEVDNMLALSMFESNYDFMTEAEAEDDKKSEEEEAKKRKKEQRKKIAKIIAITAGVIATSAAVIVTINKLKAKGVISAADADRLAKKATNNKDKAKEIQDEAKRLGNQNGLSEKEVNIVEKMLKDAEELEAKGDDESDIKAGNIRSDIQQVLKGNYSKLANTPAFNKYRGVLAVGKGLKKVSDDYDGKGKVFTITDDKDRSTEYGWLPLDSSKVKNSGLDLKDGDKVIMLSGDEYDRINDTILEKYNNNMINAETCIALMERAAERYLNED